MELEQVAQVVEAVQESLTPELVKPQYRGDRPYAGHCYVASEALYHLLGGKEAGWTPYSVRVGEVVHWFLWNPAVGLIDPTEEQFDQPVAYDTARGTGFLTRLPSKRARIVIERAKEKIHG